jgi:hypothetical protein
LAVGSAHAATGANARHGNRPTGASTREVPFDYAIKDLPAHTQFKVDYHGGVAEGTGGEAQANPSTIEHITFLDNATRVLVGDGPTDIVMTAWLSVDASAISGVLEIPAGCSATITNLYTGQSITLTNGASFTLPTG